MRFLRAVFVLAFVAVATVSATAGTISITGSTSDPRYLGKTDDTSNFGNPAAICTAFGLATDCLGPSAQLLYKAESIDDPPSATPKAEGGSLAGSYDMVFSPATGDFSGGTLTFVGGVFASCPNCVLIVKDGNHDPAQFLFSLNKVTLQGGDVLPAWDGTSAIALSGFWTGGGSISNIAIWGAPTSVPDGGATLALLGGALLALGALRGRIRR